MSHFTKPFGAKLPALEQNVLKLRAFEMILVLFEAEQLRETLIGCVQVTDQLKQTTERIPVNAGRQIKKAVKALVDDGCLNQSDADEIERLMNYRNDIAHNMHELTGDIGHGNLARFLPDFLRHRNKPGYDHKMLDKIRHYRELVWERGRSKYVFRVDVSPVLFDPARRTFEMEIRRLRRKISKQVHIRRAQTAALNRELSAARRGADTDAKILRLDNGRLTAPGIEACYALFRQNKPLFVVAHMLGLSLRSVRNRRRMWRQFSDNRRKK